MSDATCPTLAASLFGSWSSLLIALLILVGMLGGLVVGWKVLRRLLLSSEPVAPPWDLEQLRQLHEQGELSNEEYNRLRTGLLRDVTGAGPRV